MKVRPSTILVLLLASLSAGACSSHSGEPNADIALQLMKMTLDASNDPAKPAVVQGTVKSLSDRNIEGLSLVVRWVVDGREVGIERAPLPSNALRPGEISEFRLVSSQQHPGATVDPDFETHGQPLRWGYYRDEIDQPAKPAKTWTAIGAWSGTGIKETESFETVTNEWRVKWKAKTSQQLGAFITITVGRADTGVPVAVAGNQQGDSADADMSYVHLPAGRYYLGINSFNVDWAVAVEELR